MLGTVEEALGAAQQFVNQHLTYSSAECCCCINRAHIMANQTLIIALLRLKITVEKGHFVSVSSDVYILYLQRVTTEDNWMLTSASATLLVTFQHHTLVAFWHTLGHDAGVQGHTGNQVSTRNVTAAKQKPCLRTVIQILLATPLMGRHYRGQK